MNDEIDWSLASLAYVTVEHLVSLLLAQGGHPLLVKADIKEAYRMVPVHPDDHCLLGVKWEEAIYVDERLLRHPVDSGPPRGGPQPALPG